MLLPTASPIPPFLCQNRNTPLYLPSSVLMQTALSLINQAYEEGWEEMDLSGMELTELPPEGDRVAGFN